MKPDVATTPAQADCFHQETDVLVSFLEGTQDAIWAAYRASKSWRDLAHKCAVKHNVLYALAQGDWSGVGWETVRLVRSRLNLDDPGPLAYTLGCPTCGIVHAAGDCHGQPIARVAILHTGEVITAAPAPKRPKRNRKPAAVVHVPLDLHAEIIADRRPGESLADVVRRWRKHAV